ncbi:hypothetical protein NCZ17_00745 [Acinetobacter modestus]|uniref:hypothetical protein n=1 Tax=Acinetobacter modestus TaxID=1776740 RepID=UPI00202F740E|nr:hypothetical protein [Acinetobacter modestus]MCM1957898.1 hypothetical protein [Acinetobacter modestus]
MNNYKIKVNNEAESKEAQELFFELGAKCSSVENNHESIQMWSDGIITSHSKHDEVNYNFKELTLPQLRDIVSKSKNEQGLISWAGDAELVERSKKFITPDHLNRFQAAQAHLEGNEVQFMTANGDFIDITDNSTVGIFATDGGYSFRLKPHTIKLELEIPAPFEPKDGERYFYINPHADAGYGENTTTKWSKYLQFGAWRTEEEIKQVVEALRGIKG